MITVCVAVSFNISFELNRLLYPADDSDRENEVIIAVGLRVCEWQCSSMRSANSHCVMSFAAFVPGNCLVYYHLRNVLSLNLNE